MCDRSGISKTRRFDEYPIKPIASAHQAFDNADEVATDGAANAPIVHLKDVFIGLEDEIVVDPYFAEFIHDNRILSAVWLRQNAV